MTLSNFDWTDKDSVKWFILLPTGHEGPYALKDLIQLEEKKKIASNVKVWAESLAESVPLREVLRLAKKKEQVQYDLPPLPEEDEVPPLPLLEEDKTSPTKKFKIPTQKISPWVFISGAVLLMIFFLGGSFIKRLETFDIPRLPKMTINLHQRILGEHTFDGWNKEIFFKEYMPADQSHIWLVTSGFQSCSVEAQFTSIDGKMLSTENEKVAFKTQGFLDNHIVEFSNFSFTRGSKIIPGLYEMDISASGCAWNSFLAKAMNGFSGPKSKYVARTKVILFSKGPLEFNSILDKLVKKKMAIALKSKNQSDLFWQDLLQKLETLQAITLQVEQHFLDFLDEDPKKFKVTLKKMVDAYTKNFGAFLTSFVIENEKYFKSLNPAGDGVSNRRNYELLVRMTSKRIGLESMKFIEEFQAVQKKSVSKQDLLNYSTRVKKSFSEIKNDINEKLIQVSEDQSK